MNDWQRKLNSVIVKNSHYESLSDDIDEILYWFSKDFLKPNDNLSQNLKSRFSSSESETIIFNVLDKLLFQNDRAGFSHLSSVKGSAKKRYHRLLQVYHPDKAKYKQEFLHDRTERINLAYQRLKNVENVVSVSKKEMTPNFNFTQENSNSKFPVEIVSSKIRFRVILFLLTFSSLFIFYTYAKNNQSHFLTPNKEGGSVSDGMYSQKVGTQYDDYNQRGHTLVLQREELSTDEVISLEVFIDSWVKAWESQIMKRYLLHYSTDFSPEYSSYEEWLNLRSRAISNKGFIKIRINNLNFKRQGAEEVVAKFNQQYFSDTVIDETEKYLVLQQQKNTRDWKILSEKSLN